MMIARDFSAGVSFALAALMTFGVGCDEPVEGFAAPGAGGGGGAGGTSTTAGTTGTTAGTTTSGGGGEAPALPETLPFTVDEYFAPSGYMGDGQAGSFLAFDTEPCPSRAGDEEGTCHRVDYTKGTNGWAGVYWQYPDNNWGTSAGLPLPEGAARVTFWAWSDAGGETVTFVAGGIGGADTAFMDDFNVSQQIALTDTPTSYTLDLTGSPSDVIGGFAWIADGSDAGPVVFYIDDIQYEAAP